MFCFHHLPLRDCGLNGLLEIEPEASHHDCGVALTPAGWLVATTLVLIVSVLERAIIRAGGVGEVHSGLHCVRADSRNQPAQIPGWRKLRMPMQQGLLRSQMGAFERLRLPPPMESMLAQTECGQETCGIPNSRSPSGSAFSCG